MIFLWGEKPQAAVEEGAAGSVQGSLQDLWTGPQNLLLMTDPILCHCPSLTSSRHMPSGARSTSEVIRNYWTISLLPSGTSVLLPIACAYPLNMLSQSSNFRSCSQSVTRVLFQDGLWLPPISKAMVSLWQEAWLSFQKITDAEHRQGWASLLNPRCEHWSLTWKCSFLYN